MKFLPLCDSFVRVNAFVASRSQYDYGMVAHALAAGIRLLLREYLILIAQLEMQLRAGKYQVAVVISRIDFCGFAFHNNRCCISLIDFFVHLNMTGRLTMQKMWFYLQRTLQTMEQLDTIVSLITDTVGGALINKLIDASSSGGDAGARSYIYIYE